MIDHSNILAIYENWRTSSGVSSFSSDRIAATSLLSIPLVFSKSFENSGWESGSLNNTSCTSCSWVPAKKGRNCYIFSTVNSLKRVPIFRQWAPFECLFNLINRNFIFSFLSFLIFVDHRLHPLLLICIVL